MLIMLMTMVVLGLVITGTAACFRSKGSCRLLATPKTSFDGQLWLGRLCVWDEEETTVDPRWAGSAWRSYSQSDKAACVGEAAPHRT